MARIHYWDDEDAPLTESVVISRIETALDRVLEELGLDKDQSSVKPEKYVFLTIKEFSQDDDPVTYSWFKWGASTLAGPGGERTSKTLETDTSSAEKIVRADLSELEEFIKHGDHRLPIETWWDEDRLDFLERFYKEYAPPEYRSLYLSNISIKRDLGFVQSVVQRQAELITESTYRSVCDSTSGLEQAVRNIEGLSQDYQVVRYFTEIFRDTVLSLTQLSGEEIEPGQQTAISELESLYEELVWPLIAHRLSLQSAHGPNIDAIQTWSRRNHERLSEESQKVEVKEICKAMSLLREFKEYPEIKDQSNNPPSREDLPVRRVLDDRENIPGVEEFLEDHGVSTLADMTDLAFRYADGELTYRGAARALSIPPKTAFEMLEALVPVVTEVPEPQTIRPEDIDEDTRKKLLPNSFEE